MAATSRAARGSSPRTPRRPAPDEVLGHVTLVVGKEEFFNERAVAAVRAAVREHDADAEVSESPAADLTPATLGELSAPSLFSAIRCVVVSGLDALTDDVAPGILSYAAAPAEEVALVLVHNGGQKGSGVLGKLRKLDAVTEVRTESLRPSELPGFVRAEVRGHGADISDEAATALVQAVGQDARSLSAAARQLADDFPGQRLSSEVVGRFFGGRAEAKSFAVADHAFFGRTAPALEELRWALDSGTPSVLVTSAFAGSARGLARLSGVRERSDADLARDVGVPPWKVDTLRKQLRGWTPDTLGRAIRAVARADAEIKGAATDPSYTLERLVLTVAELHAGRGAPGDERRRRP